MSTRFDPPDCVENITPPTHPLADSLPHHPFDSLMCVCACISDEHAKVGGCGWEASIHYPGLGVTRTHRPPPPRSVSISNFSRFFIGRIMLFCSVAGSRSGGWGWVVDAPFFPYKCFVRCEIYPRPYRRCPGTIPVLT